ncbi:unnamed protein product [Urochloa decumbens]|uniref:Uncharacterized protein n=1 Tax=Urochloa decumbens TaxID=240449 RepID=A0ABC8XBH2_9POAL
MARLTTAASLFWALALFAVLGAGPSEGGLVEDLLASFRLFYSAQLPDPVRIYVKQNTKLNAAVRGSRVVLANIDCSDESQLWYPMLSDFKGQGFMLVNKYTGQALQSAASMESPMALATPNWKDLSQRFSQGAPRDDGFYQILAFDNPFAALNGLKGNVRDGTVIGMYRSDSVYDNSLWNLTTICPFQ